MKIEILVGRNLITRRIFYLICSFILLISVSCKTYTKKVKEKFANGIPRVIFEYEDKADTANYIIKVYYLDGGIHQEIPVRNGRFAGIITIYYPNGKVSETDSLYGIRKMDEHDWDGTAIRFYENGKIAAHFIIKNAERSGLSQYYDSNGVLVKEYYLTHDSIKNGEYREFYPNGNVFIKDTYKNDTLVGFEYVFKENGDTLKYNAFYKGNVSFPIKKWLENGNVLEGNYIDKKEKSVIWKWYDKSGKVIKTKIAFPIKGEYTSPE